MIKVNIFEYLQYTKCYSKRFPCTNLFNPPNYTMYSIIIVYYIVYTIVL